MELLQAEYTHAYSTNQGCALLTFLFSFLLSRPVWPGFESHMYYDAIKQNEFFVDSDNGETSQVGGDTHVKKIFYFNISPF